MPLRHLPRGSGFVLASLVFLATSLSAQTTWYVDDDACPGPGSGTATDPFCKIQDGIDAAARGDTVLVLPGTYFENLVFLSKGITVRSDGDGNAATHDLAPDATSIDGQQLGSVVTFTSGAEVEDSLLEGFTITNGEAVLGSGICCNDNSAPVIARNIVLSNNAPIGSSRAVGGGIYCHGSRPVITENVIRDNWAEMGCGIAVVSGSELLIDKNTIAENQFGIFSGGGIYFENSYGLILRNLVAGNLLFTKLYAGDGAGLSCWNSVVVVRDNLFADNLTIAAENMGLGGGISCVSTMAVLENNTIVGNMCGFYGGGLYVKSSSVMMRNSILWANESQFFGDGDQIYGDPDVTYCDVQDGWPGIGNIHRDPLFADEDGPDDDPWTWQDNDFHVQAGSPCIDAGAPGSNRCTQQDYFGNPRLLDGLARREPRIDMGAHEYDIVHLQVTGSATPGSTLTFTTTGQPASLVWLFVGTGPGAACLGQYGGLFFDLSSRWLLLFWGRIPGSRRFDVTVVIPGTLPVPTFFVFQELAIHAGNWGNTSNPIDIVIE